MAYDKHTWNTKEPITKNKMQNIEDGIAALDAQQTTNTQDISTLDTKLGQINVNQGGTVAQRLSDLSGDIATLQNAVGSQSSVTSRLESVETAITNAKGSSNTLQLEMMRIENESKQRDTTLTTNVNAAASAASAAQTTANNAISAIDAAKGTSGSLQERIDGIASTNTSQDTAIGTLQGRLNNPTGDNKTMEQNFSTIYSDIDGIESEIETARGVDNLNEPRENLNARFVDDEARLTSAEGRLASLETSTGDTLPTRIGAVESRMGTAEGKITAIETEINGAHREGVVNDTLDARFDAVEAKANAAAVAATVNTALEGLDGRLDAIDGGSALDTTNGTLASRVSAAESAISHAVDAGNSDPGGLTERLTAAETAIGTKANSNDMTTALAGKVSTSDFTTAINGLAAKDTVIISVPAEGSNYTNNVPNLQEPSSDCDYLIEDNNGQYFYWRYIDNNWELISGAGNGEGGGGTSSALIAEQLPAIAQADANIDYYIGNNTNGYTHYRYIPSEDENEDGAFISILPNNLINSIAVNTINVTTIDALGDTPATVQQMSGGLTAYNISHNSNLLTNFTALRYARLKRTYDTDGQTLKKQELIFTDTNGNELAPIEITGGGGSSAAYTVRLLGGTTFSVPSSQKDVVIISPRPIVNFGTTLAEGIEITATVQYKLSTSSIWQNANISIPTITNGTAFDLNVASLLGITGTTTDILVQISTQPDGSEGDIYTQSTTYHINCVDMSITALNYNPAAVRTGASFQFRYTCIGINLQKTVYFKIDGTTVATENIGTSHNDILTQSLSIADFATGMHTLQVYFMSNGISSNVINTYLICNKDVERIAPIVGLSFDSSEINQGDELTVNYTAYTPGDGVESTDKVIIEVYTMDNNIKTVIDSFELTDVRNGTVETQTITDYPDNENNTNYTLYVSIKAINDDDESLSDTTTASVIIKPFVSNYTLTYAGQDNLVYSYNAYGFTNNSANKETYTYTYTAHDQNNTQIAFTSDFNNFNWSTNGYCGRSVTTTSETGDTITSIVHDALTISGGATLDINVPIFSSTATNGVSIESDTDSYFDPTQNGRTIEIDYLVRSATDLNDVIIDCIGSNNAGFQVTPQNCFLVKANPDLSNAVLRDSTGAILNEDMVAAAYLNTGIRTHLVFVIEPWAPNKAYDQKYHQSVNIYINGEFANACPYSRDSSTGNVSDNFATDATISIGKPSCIIDLFSVKLYNRGLTHTEVLQNYKMAPAVRADKLSRFEDNDVIKNGVVDYELARKKFNCLLLVGPNPVWGINEGQRYNQMPTISPYKGAPSPIGRQKDGEVVGKTESGLIFTMPNSENQDGYQTEFSLLDKMATQDDNGYVSSNNVQGTSSQKYPIHNLKIYLMKGKAGTEVYDSDDPETRQVIGYTKSEKVKYKLPEAGVKGKGESTLCWKADYMSTDHANTFNANIADSLFSDPMDPDWPDNWRNNLQYTVHGIRCLLFQQMGDNPPEFVADGCLNNDKGNSKSYGLEYPAPDDPAEIDPTKEYDVTGTADTVAQKWEFTNNSDDLGFFKYDSLFLPIGNDQHYRALDAFESTYPDQGDLEDAQSAYKKEHDGVEDPTLNPNYNHLQILCTWIAQRANYWNASTVSGTGGTYNGVTYDTERELKKAIFKTEFTKHFILDHVLVYYLFSEYVALCDNRVKNMFMRSDTVRKEVIKLMNGDTLFEGNNNPNCSFFKEFTQIDTGEVDSETGDPIYAYNMKNVNDIDWSDDTGHSTFAKWAPVLYDLDSCFGVENVGLLKIPYNAEWQYQQNGQYLFNGHDSIFWLMFEDSFANEIAEKASNSNATSGLYNRSRGLNYGTFYREQIVANQDEIAPAMTNQDMLLKYDAPWATGFMNYANDPPTYETPEYKYLQRGSRATQKQSFIQKRSMLLSSKYQSSAFRNDRISMRYGADVAAANTTIKLSANQNFYPAVSFGDNKGWTQALKLEDNTPVINGLVNAGETCCITATSDAGGQDTLFIAGASVLTDVGDLSIFKAYEINISAAKNLKKIAFGSHAAGYQNAVTSGIGGLSSCPLLEEINIENCTIFTSLDLSANGLIKKVYTQGSGVTSVSLPTGGVLNTLELGLHTQNITLLNQSYLENFVYEDSANNHYANLHKLWIENTPNVPVVEIINNALGHLTNGVRIIGLNVNLGTDATFLQTITSDLAKGKYINSAGVQPVGTTAPPTITGQVTITSIRQSLYNKLREMYPNLTINVTSEIIPEYTITYYDYDGTTVLYEDHKTSSERYIDPVKDTNPITGTYYISMPTRNPDQQYNYYFGLYPSNAQSYDVTTYRRFTGWNKVTTSETTQLTNAYVTGNTRVVASYGTTELRSYTVEWYAETTDSTPIYSLTAEYGTRIGDYLWPDDPGFVGDGTSSQMTRAKRVNDSYYRVFTGWDRPVGILTDNVKIYGQWENSYISAATSSVNFNDLTAADLYALASVDSTTRTNLLQSHFNLDTIKVPLGNDFNYTYGVNATTLINEETSFSGDETEAIVYDGTHNHAEIRPFSTLHDFTLVIDYKPLLVSTLDNNTNEYVLASCYKETGSATYGFKISIMNTSSTMKPVVVTWGTGDTSNRYTIIDYVEINNDSATNSMQYSHAYRNIVALSYSATSPNLLNVYYPEISNNPAYYSTSITSTTLTYPTIAFDAPLIIGGNYDYTNSNNVDIEISNSRIPSSGIIYWAKYWDKDLGGQNCYKLAAWPHEELHFYITGYDSAPSEGTSRVVLPNTKLSFVTASAMGDRILDVSNMTFTGDYASYNNSSLATFYTNRIYAAFPTSYQSVIAHTTITANSNMTAIYGGQEQHLTNTADHYVFPPAEIEIFSTNSISKSREANRQWSYLKTSILQNANMIYELSGNSLVRATTVNSIAPFLYRFNNYYMNANTKIFNTGSRDPYNNGNAWTVANVGTIRLASGDIWITDNGVYVYVSDEDIGRGINIDIVEAHGGWKASNAWLLRTYTETQSDVNTWKYFIGVNAAGQFVDGGTTSQQSFGKDKGLVYEFAL